MVCKNLCVCKFNATAQSRGTLTRKLYAAGAKFCSTCSVKYENLNGFICPCCNVRVKARVRSRVRYQHMYMVNRIE